MPLSERVHTFFPVRVKLTLQDIETLKKIGTEAGIKDTDIVGNFSDRKWLKESIRDWADDNDKGKKIFWLMGGPGIGKSCLIKSFYNDTHLANLPPLPLRAPRIFEKIFSPEREEGKYCIACHFFNSYDVTTSDPVKAVLDIYLKLQKMTENNEFLLRGEFDPHLIQMDFSSGSLSALELFTKYVYDPMISRYNQFEILLFLDAIDEILDEKENRLFIREMIKKIQSPKNRAIRLLITSRNPPEYYDDENKITPYTFHSTDPRCIDDIDEYLRNHLKHALVGVTINDYIKKKIWLSSAGNFLYLCYFCHLVENDYSFTITESDYPEGLNNMYRKVFQSLFGSMENPADREYYSEHVMPYLSVLCVAQHPIQYNNFFDTIVKKNKREPFKKNPGTDFNQVISRRIFSVFKKESGDNDTDTTVAFPELIRRIDIHLSLIKKDKNRYKKIYDEHIRKILDRKYNDNKTLLDHYIDWEVEILKNKTNLLFPKSSDGTIRPKHRSVVEWLTKANNYQ